MLAGRFSLDVELITENVDYQPDFLLEITSRGCRVD